MKKLLITEQELKELLFAYHKLVILEKDGVYNWEHYMDSYDEYVTEKLKFNISKDIGEAGYYGLEDVVAADIRNFEIARERFNSSIIEVKGNLCLSYETFLGKKATNKDIEICMFNDDGSRFTIASFDYNEKEKCYELVSCCDRLNTKDINWNDFGYLVQKGYKILEK